MNRICFFNTTKAWGGGEKWHFDIGLRLHKKGNHVIFFTYPDSALYEKLKATSIPAYSIKVSNLSFLNIFKRNRIAHILEKENIETIILNLSSDVKIAGPAAVKAGVKNIIYRRGLAKPIKNSFFNRYLFSKVVTHVICNSRETRRTVFQNNPKMISPDKVTVIYNGIDIDTLPQMVNPSFPKEDPEIIHIGNLGRLVEQKGQRHLVEMAAIMQKEGTHFHIFIGGSGPLEQDLIDYAKQLNVSDKITFSGFVSDVHSFMQSLDVFILPSYWEGFGYVLVEAMVNALPVVAFDITSNPEVVEDEKTGFLCEAGDTEELVEKTNELIRKPDLRHKLGQAGKKRVLSRFTIQNTVMETEKLLSAL
ncbi:MAG: glycosyltransferase [Bacteroidetes bacterium]|jgi:glycosyltransferase involved in cell wall biosynthesis|nr:glycosyltransferase [Bacteroidota bacterium]